MNTTTYNSPAAIYTPEQIWEMITSQLRLQLDPNTFNAYVRDTRLLECAGDCATIAASSAIAREWLAGRLTSTVQKQIAPLLGRPVTVQFVYLPESPKPAGQGSAPAVRSKPGRVQKARAVPAAVEEASTSPGDRPGENPRRLPGQAIGAGGDASISHASTYGKTPPKRRAEGEAPAQAQAAPGRSQAAPERSQAVPGQSTAEAAPFPNEQDQASAARGQVCAPAVDSLALSMELQPAKYSEAPVGQHDAAAEKYIAKAKSAARSERTAAVSLCAEESIPSSGSGAVLEENETGPEETAEWVEVEEISDSIEAALQDRGRLVAFPRYELRHLPLVGPEFFFLRLAFLQQRFLNTQPNGRGQPFVTAVESLLQWANVGRATLHRFKKGDPARGVQPAADWFGIEQLPVEKRESAAQPPCRYRLQTAIPLTPMDAARLRDRLIEAGIQRDPLQALETLCARPVQEILQFPPPAPGEEYRAQKPSFTTVSSVVQQALEGRKIPAGQRADFQDQLNRLSDHITMPQQVVFVSWYFLREWLPILGHDAAALVLYTRAQGYYNPQMQEVREVVPVSGGYGELASVIGLKRQRTIGDWLPNIFDRQSEIGQGGAGESEKWKREQVRQKQAQERIARFIQVVPGSRRKTAEGPYAFDLRVEIKGEPLTPQDEGAARWVRRAIAACAEQDVLEHFTVWVTSPVIARLAERMDIDGAGILPSLQLEPADNNDGMGILADYHPDGWGILEAREMTARESGGLDDDGWEILEEILNDGAGILRSLEMTAGELFKRLYKLNTFWKTIPAITNTTTAQAEESRVVGNWDLPALCQRNGGMNPYRQEIISREEDAGPLLSWLLYAYSLRGQGIKDPFGWALARIKDQPGGWAEGAFAGLAQEPPAVLAGLLRRQIESGATPQDPHWQAAFRDAPVARLRELAGVLGVG